ncbi:Uncharacterised protein [uncultured archaeon]|nr:Uncharacterised protein [uncultured archaeon]
MKGQLSAEMLIVLVVILGLAVLLASVMMNSANKAAKNIEQKTDTVLNASGTAGKYPSGYVCQSGADCLSGNCDAYTSKCL